MSLDTQAGPVNKNAASLAEALLDAREKTFARENLRQPGVLGRSGAPADLRGDELRRAGLLQRRQFLRHHPQLRLYRRDGAWHDAGDHHRRHRSVGRLDDGPGGDRLRHRPAQAADRLYAGLVERGGVDAHLVDGAGGGPGGGRAGRLGQRRAHRLSRPAALRGDAGHAVGRALAGRRALGKPHALQFPPDQAVSFKIIGGGDNLGLPLPFRASNPFLHFRDPDACCSASCSR